jgi:hypothetical protein
MFIGHYGVAFALKRAETALSLGVLFLAVQLADILWPIFVLLGLDKHDINLGLTAARPLIFRYFPFGHDILTLSIWAVLAFAIFMLLPIRFRGNKLWAGAIIAIGIISYYILNLIMPDWPWIAGNSTKTGLGLWHYPLLLVLLELSFLWGGLWIYLRGTWGKGFWGKNGAVALALLLTILEFIGMAGTPPNNPKLMSAIVLIVNAVIIGLAFRLDHLRIPVKIKIIYGNGLSKVKSADTNQSSEERPKRRSVS